EVDGGGPAAGAAATAVAHRHVALVAVVPAAGLLVGGGAAARHGRRRAARRRRLVGRRRAARRRRRRRRRLVATDADDLTVTTVEDHVGAAVEVLRAVRTDPVGEDDVPAALAAGQPHVAEVVVAGVRARATDLRRVGDAEERL